MAGEVNSADKDKVLEEALKASLVNGKLPCPVAFQLAAKYKVSTRTIGDLANKLKIKITSCQLGCFP